MLFGARGFCFRFAYDSVFILFDCQIETQWLVKKLVVATFLPKKLIIFVESEVFGLNKRGFCLTVEIKNVFVQKY